MQDRTMPTVDSLAALKRFLALPGTTLQVVRNDWSTQPFWRPKPGYWEPKQVAKLQGNAVQFTTGSWLRFPKASMIRFAPQSQSFLLCMNDDGTFREVLEYALSLVPEV